MKKLLLILLLAPLFLNAQKSMRAYNRLNSIVHDPRFYFYDEPFAPAKLRKQLQVKEVRISSVNHKGKKRNSLMTFNKAGKTVRQESKNRKVDYTYENDSLETSRVTQTKRHVSETRSTFQQGKIASREIFKDNKQTSKTQLTYNAAQKVTNTVMSEGRKKYEIITEYGADDKIARSTFLMNGKIKKEWIYECKPEGEILASKTVAMSSFCTYREENLDGSYSTFTRSQREGKSYLFKQTFNKDSVLISAQSFLDDTKLLWESKKENGVETQIGYSKSGKRQYKQVKVYNAAGNEISREFFTGKKDKAFSKVTYDLNPDGTTKVQQYFWKGKLTNTTSYEYTFF